MTVENDIYETRKRIKKVLEEVELAIVQANQESFKMGVDVYALRTPDGNWIMNKLVCAKAQALHSLLLLAEVERSNAT